MEIYVIVSIMFCASAFTYWIREILYTLRESEKLLRIISRQGENK